MNGRGTTYEASNYQFTDAQPMTGVNYYRLKQLDYDGVFEYSDVVSVDFPSFGNLESLRSNLLNVNLKFYPLIRIYNYNRFLAV